MVDWEQRYQTGDTPWEKGEAAPPLMEILEKKGDAWLGEGPVLVPGCGYGHDVRVLSKHARSVIGMDLAESAVRQARLFPRIRDESYELGDFLSGAVRGDRRVTAIWEHTCFCAIDPSRRGDYARSVAEWIEEGGVLAGVFFVASDVTPGDGPPFFSTLEEIQACFAPWFEFLEGWVPERSYPGREGAEWVGIFCRRANTLVAESDSCH